MKLRKTFALLLGFSLLLHPVVPDTLASSSAYPEVPDALASSSVHSNPGEGILGKGRNLSENADDAMVLNKTATQNSDGSYAISLEAYATGESITSTITKEIPTDVVLVLDQSGSMAESMYRYEAVYNPNQNENYYILRNGDYQQVTYSSWYRSWGYNSVFSGFTRVSPKTSEGDTTSGHIQFYARISSGIKLDALKDAVSLFADSVAQQSKGEDGTYGTSDDVPHRIAVVGYSSTGNSYNNTELLTGVTITKDSSHYYGTQPNTQDNYYFPNGYAMNGIQYSALSTANYQSAMQDMTDDSGRKNVTEAVDALTAYGGTYTNLGMEMASRIFANNPIGEGEQRNRVVVLFTDGIPGLRGYDPQIAGQAITQGNIVKNDYQATVYTVGIFTGADAGTAGNPNGYQNGDEVASANWFMQNLSSNNGEVKEPGYYLAASDSGELKAIFQKISEQIQTGGTTTTLDEEAVVKDVVSQYFELPEGVDASGINIEVYSYIGSSFDDSDAWEKDTAAAGGIVPKVDGRIVEITGFPFSENWCGAVKNETTQEQTYRGKKLVITFPIVPRNGFLGGNGVPTNGETSGIYENSQSETAIKYFDIPVVQVPIPAIRVTAENKNVYLFGDLGTGQLLEGATVKAGEVSLDILKKEENWGLASWQNAFVDIACAVEKVAYSSLTEDTVYTITCTVSPKTGDGAKYGSGEADICVFKPELTCSDSIVYYGEEVPECSTNLSEVEWKHPSAQGSILGEAPALSLTCTPDAGKIQDGRIFSKTDIGVDVTVRCGETDVTEYTTFLHKSCEGQSCILPDGMEFLLHVRTCQLTVTKNGGAEEEPYLFTIYKDGQKYTELTVVGNRSETVYELPVGNYTIREVGDWSWRYTPDQSEYTAELDRDCPKYSCTCTNTKENKCWLNGFSDVVTNFFGKDGKS